LTRYFASHQTHLLSFPNHQQEVDALPDPCPLPHKDKQPSGAAAAAAAADGGGGSSAPKRRRTLSDKERLIHAPLSDVGGMLFDRDAVYIDLPDWNVRGVGV
jgi:ribosome biogenesis protein BMS1